MGVRCVGMRVVVGGGRENYVIRMLDRLNRMVASSLPNCEP